jgi:tetratricopeptide (TPR) repeat protein
LCFKFFTISLQKEANDKNFTDSNSNLFGKIMSFAFLLSITQFQITMLVIMKLKQLILAAIFIVSCFSIGFAQTDREKGVELFNKGDFQGAVDVLKQVVKSNENDVIALYNLGLAYEKLNQNKDAIKSFEKVINVCNNLIQKTIEEKYVGVNETNNIETLGNAIKKHDKELEIGYLSIQKFSQLNPKDVKSQKWADKISIVEMFAPNSEIAKAISSGKPSTNLKITKQPRAGYTDGARRNGTRGQIQILALFLASGKVGMVIPLNRLPNGLTENAIEAAKQIEFKPAYVGDKPISVWKSIIYVFYLY